MTGAEASVFAWDVAADVVRFVMWVAVALLGFALLREMTR